MFKSVNSNENFPEMEKKWLKYWYEKGIDKKYREKNKNSKEVQNRQSNVRLIVILMILIIIAYFLLK